MKDLLGIGFDMLFSELYKIMFNEFTFVGFRGGDRPNCPLLNLILPLTAAVKLEKWEAMPACYRFTFMRCWF